MYNIQEGPSIVGIPKNIKETGTKTKPKIRFEACLQTAGDINRNKRKYSKGILEDGVGKINDRIHEGTLLGELDHPVTSDPKRQFTVLYKEVSHKINETYWDGNRLIGVLESLSTPNGKILRNLVAEDGVPIGFSLRAVGDLRTVHENGQMIKEVVGPLNIITWDSVSYPSHNKAKITKITEGAKTEVSNFIYEKTGVQEVNGMVITDDGMFFTPNDFDELVERKIVNLVDKFSYLQPGRL